MKIPCCLLCIMLLLSGCGLGDVTVSLVDGYEIWKDGDYCSLQKADGVVYTAVVNDLYINRYALSGAYIAVDGVPLGNNNAETNVRGYYLVNTQTHAVYGMFDSLLQLQYQCEELEISAEFDWTEV